MVFSSVTFLFYYLPALIILYYVAPQKLKNLVMFLASMVFYAWGEIRFIPVMLALSVEDYVCARLMDKYADHKRLRRLFMLISVGSNLGVLLFFKYTNFFVGNLNALVGGGIPQPNIILPIGVSFNSFQSISYAIDVYRGTTNSEKSYYNYLTYTTLFPQIIAGPIVRYVTVEHDLDDHLLTADSFSRGTRRFLIGLGKKVLIANNVGFLWSQISTGAAGEPSVLLYWIGIIAYTFQIYFDFSGYSDMAIGLARIFGLTFDENFNYPYISRSITEFWRRWHITLGAWFRDYVYIPMGGNRCGKLKQLRNLLVVWALTGFWHGASWNFVFWGLYFAIILIIEKFVLLRFWDKVPRILQHIYALVLIIISWVIFYFEDLSAMGAYFRGMFGWQHVPLWNKQALYYLLGYGLIFVLAAFFATPVFQKLLIRLECSARKPVLVGVSLGYVFLFAACVAYLVNSTYNPFLYFRF
ncbi:MBOAT family O-acyltransferase [Hydrogenoanaerobacterium sp.]|uniref:MBOAT family O-acyltransferase n=1 Tax=Hydrogenoanaerobacterium sp. TaxID=2953763 RepID=UPI00289F0745|nr:MBOAT family O-acyltransferase [Hydrogenoanaerobacterium sp.]